MAKKTVSIESLRDFVRKEATQFLKQPNVTSMGVGYKIKDGRPTKEVCIQFTVGCKIAPEVMKSMAAAELPKSFVIDGFNVPTDVVQRSYDKDAREIRFEAKPETVAPRKSVINPVVPGVSIGHPTISAGTAGCVVYDAVNGTPYILSNWHVLHGTHGQVGDDIVQPGRHDDNRIDRNTAGKLVRSHLGVAGDCAIATIDHRRLSADIMEIGRTVARIGEPELGDKVIKSGRTTGVTRGLVQRVHVISRINYGEIGEQNIGCFEIGPDPAHPAPNGEISMGGDSGAAWLTVQGDTPSDMMLGLHFAGEVGDESEHALACYAGSVFEKLGICPSPPRDLILETEGKGYDNNFFGSVIPHPAVSAGEISDDVLAINGRVVFDYTHFSLSMSRSRKFARWVAWNIDGGAIRRISRTGTSFRKDQNLPFDAQVGDELYAGNSLDRGHIARRADLIWGSLPEAKSANADSFFFTNIAPQHKGFNQSSAGGIWGKLEDAVFAEVDVTDLKVSVIGGPIFTETDPLYRGLHLPKRFWKIIYFREVGDETIKAKGYVLTQDDLLSNLEALELPEFSVFEVPISRIGEMTGLSLYAGSAPEMVSRSVYSPENGGMETGIRRICSEREILG